MRDRAAPQRLPRGDYFPLLAVLPPVEINQYMSGGVLELVEVAATTSCTYPTEVLGR